MTLSTLLDMYTNGALKVTHNSGDVTCNLGGVELGEQQAAVICTNLGWLNWHLSPFEILKKTHKFIGSMRRCNAVKTINPHILNSTVITFQNFRGNTYGKTYDRITLTCNGLFEYTIIYGMEKQGAAYMVYKTGQSTPVAKCRNVGKVFEYIVSNME